MATRDLGIPVPAGGDANNIPTDLGEIRDRLDAIINAPRFTTTERDALSGTDLWDGRVIQLVDTDGALQHCEVFHADDPADPSLGGTWDVLVTEAFANATYAPIEAVAARASLSANQSIPHNTTTVIEIDQSDYDPNGLFDSANNLFSLDRDGKWLVIAFIAFATNGTGARHARPRKNSDEQVVAKIGASDSEETSVAAVDVINAVAGDQILMRGLQGSGGALDVVGGNSFWTFLSVSYLGK